MKKAEQIAINKRVLDAMRNAMNDVESTYKNNFAQWASLDHCQAEYLFTISGCYIALKSYSTVVAAVDIEDGICYDFSRWVYGYTATTTQHIYKFAKKFCASVLSYKPVEMGV